MFEVNANKWANFVLNMAEKVKIKYCWLKNKPKQVNKIYGN